MSVFRPARQYLPASVGAAVLAVVSAWCGTFWGWAFLPAVLFAGASAALYYLGSRPTIEFSERGLRIGDAAVPWEQIQRVNSTAWTSPLVLNLTLQDERRMRLIYPGDTEGVARLARQLRRRISSRYGDDSGQAILADRPTAAGPVSAEDEADIERLYQQLRAAGRMDVSGADE